MNLIERIDEARATWHVLNHPFYLRWECGELTHRELAFYAGEYRHAVVALADAAAAGGDTEHAAEEAAHVALWDDFAAALDAPPLDRSPNTETIECASAWRRDEPLEARAVLYAIESGQPDISRTKLEGLVEHYGFTPATQATAYFELHSIRDHEHAAASAKVLRDAPPEEADRLLAAAEAALRGNWRLLDGVNVST
jgi:pyrroloquinoline-quinone synthase